MISGQTSPVIPAFVALLRSLAATCPHVLALRLGPLIPGRSTTASPAVSRLPVFDFDFDSLTKFVLGDYSLSARADSLDTVPVSTLCHMFSPQVSGPQIPALYRCGYFVARWCSFVIC